jgi:3'-phosphoadenosine 5'-phosphosulfate sulfotransferase (PAPS reductase)/FAD synthetase
MTKKERIDMMNKALETKVRLSLMFGQSIPETVNLHDFDLVVVNSSGGKDSVVALWQIVQMADAQGYERSRIHVSHQDLGRSEWPGVTALVHEQAAMFGLKVHVSRRRTQEGKEETLLEYAKRRGKWPSSAQRWCTSDFKRAPGARVITQLGKNHAAKTILQVFGFRAEESPSRSKRPVLSVNATSTTNSRTVIDFLPVHDQTEKWVWSTIRTEKLPYHHAYDLGMPRLSCMFCIFAPAEALAIAGKANPDALQEYVDAEREMGHSFKADLSLADVQAKLQTGYTPTKVSDWTM